MMFAVFCSCFPEAEKAAQVSKIQYDQKVMEKESMRKMSEIEGGCRHPVKQEN